MTAPPEPALERRFACTLCGACCNRSPEVELSEAAGLADLFVFRLMFRLYELPRAFAPGTDGRSAEAFYETKRLLAAFAARKWPAKRKVGGRSVEYVRYLTISALTLDGGTGACGALEGGRCSIYERRPLSCRTVPLHYSRPEATAGADLDAFVARPGFACDTGEAAPVVFAGGRILDDGWRTARAGALTSAGDDRAWREAIVRRLKPNVGAYPLPSLREIEEAAPRGALTASMRVAWQIAADAGLMTPAECRALIEQQTAAIDRALAAPREAPEARRTLADMRAEYRLVLAG